MTIQGKGFMIWKIRDCEGGNPAQIAALAQSAGLTHVLIKIADGTQSYNVDRNTGSDLVPAVVQALKAIGLQVWGWHYVYGYNPVGEAKIAVQRTLQLGLDGYVIDAEVEYKLAGRDAVARTYMAELRNGIPNVPVALCSFRFPSYHPQFPWTAFLERCDYNMPQVYWEKAHNAGDQLRRSVREFQGLSPVRPVIPTGPVYTTSEWAPTAAEVYDFLLTTRMLGLASANFFAWDYGRSTLQPLWNTISSFSWGSSATNMQELPELYINTLNSHNVEQVLNMYLSNSVHITASETIQGFDAIRSWYNYFLFQAIPNATFTLTAVSGSGNSRFFTWQAQSASAKIIDGNDTFGLIDGKVSYHYSSYKIIN
jgi:hypothetical protein